MILRALVILVVFCMLIPYVKAENEGKRLYIQRCTGCHNTNPSKAGSIGPDLYTTPREVFLSKVPKGTYPPGYKPKRTSKAMPKFKFLLTSQIDLIYNYIQSTRK